MRSAIIACFFAAFSHAQDLISLLESRNDLSTFVETLQRIPELLESLSSASNITILAPNNDAFIPPDSESEQTSLSVLTGDDLEALTNVLSYHVLNGAWDSESLAGRNLIHTLYDNGLVTGGQVLFATTIDEPTVFFEGGRPSFISSNTTNIIDAGNGVLILTIDGLLEPPRNLSTILEGYEGGYAFLEGLEDTDFLAEIEAMSDLTILLPEVDASGLDNVTGDDLEFILRYHIIPGQLFDLYGQAEDGNDTRLPTLQGGSISVTHEEHAELDGELPIFNDVAFVAGDILLANGILHTIERFLDPADSPGPAEDTSDESTGDAARPMAAGFGVGLVLVAAAFL